MRRELNADLVRYHRMKMENDQGWEHIEPKLLKRLYERIDSKVAWSFYFYRVARDAIELLTELLSADAEDSINTWDISERLSAQYGELFDADMFEDFCFWLGRKLDGNVTQLDIYLPKYRSPK